jgi:glycerophosphoryl diester phosphodiesterase
VSNKISDRARIRDSLGVPVSASQVFVVGVVIPSAFATILRAAWPLLVFEATIALAAVILLEPLLVLLVEQVVSLGGDPFVGNAALVSFVLSPSGIVALATAATGSILVNMVELGGVSLVLWDARARLQARQLEIWRALVRRLPVLLAVSACGFAAALLLTLPVLATGFAARHWFLASGDLYFYISTRPPEFLRAVAVIGVAAAAAAAIAVYFLLRFALVVPICLLRPISIGPALRLALQATKGRPGALILRLLGIGAGLIVLWWTTLSALFRLLRWFFPQSTTDTTSHWAGIGLALMATVALAALAAITRAGIVWVLIADRAADEALPKRPESPPVASALRQLRLVALVLLCAAILAAAPVETPWVSHVANPAQAIAITAHRAGSAHAPENTLAALRNAIVEGADAVEVDAQETADGEVVLLHDTDLRRVAGVARSIWDLRYSDLQGLDVGSWFSPTFKAERIPTLRAFAAASRGRIRLNVEIKNNKHGEDLAARVVNILHDTGTADQAVVSSLDIELLRQARRIAPEIKLGLILAAGVGDFRKVDVDFFALSRRLATPAVIRQLHAIGREVHVWTLNDQSRIAQAMLDGADDIITSDPSLGVKVRLWFHGLSEPERALLRIGHFLGTSRLHVELHRPSPTDDL